MLGLWGRFLAFLGFGGCAMQGDFAGEGQSVMFIGNSYSFGVPGVFTKVSRERGKRVRVGHATHGGWTLKRHAEHEPTLRKLRGRKWDVVVIQDHSLNPVLPDDQRRVEMDEAVAFFASEGRQMGARVMIYQTWGRRDGDNRLDGDDFFAMNERVRRGVREAARYAGRIEVVPVGDAWEEEFRAGRGRELFTEDGSHPSQFGDGVTAGVFYEVIFGGR